MAQSSSGSSATSSSSVSSEAAPARRGGARGSRRAASPPSGMPGRPQARITRPSAAARRRTSSCSGTSSRRTRGPGSGVADSAMPGWGMGGVCECWRRSHPSNILPHEPSGNPPGPRVPLCVAPVMDRPSHDQRSDPSGPAPPAARRSSEPESDPPSDAAPESCDWCGSADLWWRNCKLLCRSCSAIVKSCADL